LPTSAVSISPACDTLLWAICLCALGATSPALAAKSAGKTALLQGPAGLGAAFSDIARQRPRACKEQLPFDAPLGWRQEPAQCAWQDRLRMRSWTGPGGEALDACVSTQARWWAWAGVSARATAQRPGVWDGSWERQALIDNERPDKRIVTLERLPDGAWRTVEWRWNPAPKPATRRWQEGRWAELTARAARLQQAAQPGVGGEADMLRAVLLANADGRVAEVGGNILNYQSDALCLQVDTASPGQQQLQLPYLAEDSRLEQRAAMQLQLARRFPKAHWLTPFSLLPMPPKGKGGAKFYALWMENSVVKGQLWIPTKGAGPLVRARITIALPGAVEPPPPDAAPVGVARRVLERELTSLATRWAHQYE